LALKAKLPQAFSTTKTEKERERERERERELFVSQRLYSATGK